MAQRAPTTGCGVVPSDALDPPRATGLREVGGDKLFVVYDPRGRLAPGASRSPTRWPARVC